MLVGIGKSRSCISDGLREINILQCQMDENGGRLGEGQSNSPYLITISLITIPRVEYYTVQTQFALVINTLRIMQMRLYKRLSLHHSTGGHYREGLTNHPPTHSSNSGLILIAPIFAWPRVDYYTVKSGFCYLQWLLIHK